VPKNKLGIQMPRSGGSMVGIYCSLTDYREYIETELKEKLQKGEKYRLSFWVSLSEYSPEAVATIGGLFTKEMLSDTTRGMLTNNSFKQSGKGVTQNISTFYKPQVVNPFARVLADTLNWMKVEGEFVAQGGEKFLTIGNFYPAEQSNVVSVAGLRNILPGAYYYIDDVELYCISCGQTKQIGNIAITKTIDTVSYSVGSVIVLENIFFEFDKSVLLPQSYVELHNLINLLNKHPNMKIELSGHTDNKGKDKYNMELSLNRAKAVYDYLILAGIDKKRLKYKGYGAKQPIADNKTEEGRAKNRRVEFKITDM
ncbi:MAG: OmpA family protein, partial [Bacteroidota bacterium]|nr:OmpA family protein [Bacteroidota bacterium]